MKMNIKVDFITKEVEITKAFYKRAEQYGSEEYYELLQIKKDLPDFIIKERKMVRRNNRNPHQGLTYKYMESFLAENNKADLEEFYEMRELFGDYFTIKKWFLKKYEFNYKNF